MFGSSDIKTKNIEEVLKEEREEPETGFFNNERERIIYANFGEVKDMFMDKTQEGLENFHYGIKISESNFSAPHQHNMEEQIEEVKQDIRFLRKSSINNKREQLICEEMNGHSTITAEGDMQDKESLQEKNIEKGRGSPHSHQIEVLRDLQNNFIKDFLQEFGVRLASESSKRLKLMDKKIEEQNDGMRKLKLMIKDASERAHVISHSISRIQPLIHDVKAMTDEVKRVQNTIVPEWIEKLKNEDDAGPDPRNVPDLDPEGPLPPSVRSSGRFASASRERPPLHSDEDLPPRRDGCHGALRILVAEGASLNKKLSQDHTPLHVAVHLGHVMMISAMLDNGADVNALDARGRSPLHGACTAGHAAVAALLLRRGAAIEAVDGRRRTALHMAALAEREGCVAVLLSSGANRRALDEDGRAALELARSEKTRLAFRRVMKCFRCRRMDA